MGDADLPQVGGLHGELYAQAAQAGILRFDIVHGKGGGRDALLKDAFLVGQRGGVAVRLQHQLDLLRPVGRDDGQPAGLAEVNVVLLDKPEHVRIKAQGVFLVIDKYAGQYDLHFNLSFINILVAEKQLSRRNSLGLRRNCCLKALQKAEWLS